MLVQYSSRYESSPFNTGAGGTSADYAWMLCIGAALLCGFGALFGLVFLGQSVSFMILYVWARKNPDESTSLFGLKIQAFYLPWAIVALNFLIGSDVFGLILGIVAGHIYFFLHFIAPATYGWTLIRTPKVLIEAFGGIPQPTRAVPNAPRQYAGHTWGTGNALGAN